jgi:hypothetical protein
MLHSVVVRLGGFHTQVSFLGSIGHLMGGSGLHELLEVIYAGNTIGHMLSGKAVARVVRGHLLVDAALNTLLGARIFDVDLPSEDTTQNVSDDVPTDNTDVIGEPSTSSVSVEAMSDNGDLQALTDVQANDLVVKLREQIQREKEIMHTITTGR